MNSPEQRFFKVLLWLGWSGILMGISSGVAFIWNDSSIPTRSLSEIWRVTSAFNVAVGISCLIFRWIFKEEEGE